MLGVVRAAAQRAGWRRRLKSLDRLVRQSERERTSSAPATSRGPPGPQRDRLNDTTPAGNTPTGWLVLLSTDNSRPRARCRLESFVVKNTSDALVASIAPSCASVRPRDQWAGTSNWSGRTRRSGRCRPHAYTRFRPPFYHGVRPLSYTTIPPETRAPRTMLLPASAPVPLA